MTGFYDKKHPQVARKLHEICNPSFVDYWRKDQDGKLYQYFPGFLERNSLWLPIFGSGFIASFIVGFFVLDGGWLFSLILLIPLGLMLGFAFALVLWFLEGLLKLVLWVAARTKPALTSARDFFRVFPK